MAKNISEALEQSSLSGVDSCADCEQLMYELKEKLNISDRRQKIQILTLMPDRWSIDQVSKFLRAKLFGQKGSSTENRYCVTSSKANEKSD